MSATPLEQTPPPKTPLQELARAHGIDTDFHDWQGRPCTVADDTLRAVLTALDVDASSDEACRAALAQRQGSPDAPGLPPCVVIREGQGVELPSAADASLELEAGEVRALPSRAGALSVPADLPLGYHRLVVATGTPEEATVAVVVTPQQLGWPAAMSEPGWGLATQLYSVRSEGSWGVGDLTDLTDLATWSATQHGADFVLVNPMHAAEVVPPMEPSPYLPTSRRFANPLYLRVEAVPEYATAPPAVRAEIERVGADIRAAQNLSDEIHRDACWAAKRDALQRLHASGLSASRRKAYEAYLAEEGADLTTFATWSVLCELHGTDWRDWPEPLRDARSTAVLEAVAPHADRVDFYCWLQWLLEEQLTEAHRHALGSGMRVGVIHDVAVGVSPAGADAWAWRDVMATDVTVGAPPDAYSQLGQDWQQPPWRPDRLRETAYAPLRAMFRSALRHSGGLRVDHVIGLFRLWWVPAGARADQGTYVRYDHEALIGILALEAQRAGAVIIGEDLGNVEPTAREHLRERGLLGTSILWFESDWGTGDPLPPQRWRRDCLASVTTHDLPPTTGYLRGDHVLLRDRLGLLTRPLAEELAADRRDQDRWIDELVRTGLLDSATAALARTAREGAEGKEVDDAEEAVVVALHRVLTRSPARLRCVALTDAVGERRTQNQPGTVDEYPNWRVPLAGPDGRAQLIAPLLAQPRAARVITAASSVAPSSRAAD